MYYIYLNGYGDISYKFCTRLTIQEILALGAGIVRVRSVNIMRSNLYYCGINSFGEAKMNSNTLHTGLSLLSGPIEKRKLSKNI